MATKEDTRDEEDQALGRALSGPRRTSTPPSPADDEPADEDILRYVDGVMSDSERTVFEAALATHPWAAERVAIVAEALDESGAREATEAPAAATEPVGRRVIEGAARFLLAISDGALTFLRGVAPRELAAGAVRGLPPTVAPSHLELEQQFPAPSGPLDARLSLESSPGRRFELALEVSRAGVPLDGLRVRLVRDGRPLDSAPTEHGRCAFYGLGPALYDVELGGDGELVGRIVLDVRDAG